MPHKASCDLTNIKQRNKHFRDSIVWHIDVLYLWFGMISRFGIRLFVEVFCGVCLTVDVGYLLTELFE